MPHKALIITSNQQLCQDIEDSLQGLSLEFHHADGYMQALSMVARYHYIRSHGDRLCPCFTLQLMRMFYCINPEKSLEKVKCQRQGGPYVCGINRRF